MIDKKSRQTNNQALNMVIAMHRADLLLTHYLDKVCRRVSGISYSQLIVLLAIAELGHASQAEIASTIGITPASMHPHISRLQKRELIHQEHSYSHQRSHVVYLTKAAERALPLTSSLLESALAPLFTGTNPTAYTTTAAAFARLARRLQRAQMEEAG